MVTHQFSVAEYEQMHAAGIFHEDDRIELIDGKVVEMAAAGSRHIAVVRRLNRILSGRVGARALLSIQDFILIGEKSLLEPDVALIAPRSDDYETVRTTAADILLLIEVADSSLDYDRLVKEPVYAAAGIPEYWLVDLVLNRIEVRTQPGPAGYARIVVSERNDAVSPTAFPDVTILVTDLLPLV